MIKIEEGKRYLDRLGRIVGPMVSAKAKDFPEAVFKASIEGCPGYSWYTSEGCKPGHKKTGLGDMRIKWCYARELVSVYYDPNAVAKAEILDLL